MNAALIGTICLPLIGALAAFVFQRRWASRIGLITAILTTTAVLHLAWQVMELGPQRHHLGGWAAPLGIELFVDGLNITLLVMTAGVALLISFAAAPFFPEKRKGWSTAHGFWPLWLVLWGAMNLTYLSADLFNVYVGLELVGLSAIAMIVLDRHREALTAAMRYLLATLLGSLSYLMGVAIMYGGYGMLDMYLLGERVEPALSNWTALTLMSVGLMLKTAIFPLHFWLPLAHANAPAPVSAALSALVVKVSFYLILRLWFGIFDDALTVPLGQLVGVLATSAIVGGSILAIFQRRLKLMVAYSTVAQIGYLFLVVPLTIPFGAATQWHFDGWAGGLYHVFSHALAKSSMFLAAGAVTLSIGTDRLRHCRGMAQQLPISTFAFALAGVSLMGLPPSGGFIAKWFMVNAAIETGQWWWAVVMLVGGLLTAIYVFVVIRIAFLPFTPPEFKPVAPAVEYSALALALLALAIGLRASEPFALLQQGQPFVTPLPRGSP